MQGYYAPSTNLLTCNSCISDINVNCLQCSGSNTCTLCAVGFAGIKCDICDNGYIGLNCGVCDNGYYSDIPKCISCKTIGIHCDTCFDSSSCLTCMVGFTGTKCENCFIGY